MSTPPPLPPSPPSSAQPLRIPDPTPAQESIYDAVSTTTTAWPAVPGTTSPLTPGERTWLSRPTILRYLRATRWDADAALARLASTLTWRRSLAPPSPATQVGKLVLHGWDKHARPVVYYTLSKERDEAQSDKLANFIYILDSAVDLMPPGVETLSVIVRLGGGAGVRDLPSVETVRGFIKTLQDHFPERLGVVVFEDLGWGLGVFLKMVSVFMDAETRGKIRVGERVGDWVGEGQGWSGELGEGYWGELERMAGGRRGE